MPLSRRSNLENEVIDVLDLNMLFETDDENDELFGFNVTTENSNETFLDLRQIFMLVVVSVTRHM